MNSRGFIWAFLLASVVHECVSTTFLTNEVATPKYQQEVIDAIRGLAEDDGTSDEDGLVSAMHAMQKKAFTEHLDLSSIPQNNLVTRISSAKIFHGIDVLTKKHGASDMSLRSDLPLPDPSGTRSPLTNFAVNSLRSPSGAMDDPVETQHEELDAPVRIMARRRRNPRKRTNARK